MLLKLSSLYLNVNKILNTYTSRLWWCVQKEFMFEVFQVSIFEGDVKVLSFPPFQNNLAKVGQ